MELFKPGPELAHVGLQAMTMVAKAAQGGLNQPQQALLAAAQQIILHTDLDVEALPPITPAELATKFKRSELAHQLIRGMVVMSLADGPTSPEQSELIAAFAHALEVKEPAIKTIQDLAEQHLLLFRLDFYRRSHLRDYIATQYRTQGGIIGVAKGILGLRGLIEDQELAQRFYALGHLPNDTLGYHFFHHYKDSDFAFPGEKGGFPVGGVFHDLGHVLGGYGTTPEGEMQVGAFQAGYRRTPDAFFTLLFPLLIFSAGINVAPIELPDMHGLMGQKDVAAKVLVALKRGAAMTVDLGADWDFWPHMDQPLEAVRQRMEIVPLAQALAAAGIDSI